MAGAKRNEPSAGLPRVGMEWDEESTADERKMLTRAVDTSKLLEQSGERKAPPPGFFPQRPTRSAPGPLPSFVEDESTADGHTQILRPDVELIIDEASLNGDELAAIEADRQLGEK